MHKQNKNIPAHSESDRERIESGKSSINETRVANGLPEIKTSIAGKKLVKLD